MESPEKFWLDSSLYIPIDRDGYCTGERAEGALGFVAQVLDRNHPDTKFALKFPRLVGETHQENAYMNDLMETEAAAVAKVHTQGAADEASRDSLLGYHRTREGGPLRGPIEATGSAAEGMTGALILVHFDRERGPRFVTVWQAWADGKATQHVASHPPGVNHPIKDVATLERIRAASVGKGRASSETAWARTVFVFADGEESYAQRIVGVEQALQVPPSSETWYACLPSVVYDWAPGTLQASISLRLHQGWTRKQDFELIDRIASALAVLHGKGMLHGDLRPANIARRGKIGPDTYYLNDYGSFSDAGVRAADRRSSPSEGTVWGPVIATERVSAFYSTERREGREREEADVAIILAPDGVEHLYIVLGWKERLLAEPGSFVDGKLSSDARERLLKLAQRTVDSHVDQAPADSAGLHSGDRIQIQDFIFDVDRCVETFDHQVLRCERNTWKVYQGRIAVKNKTPLGEATWFPISRTSELHQWSAATDLYGLGAIFLYLIFRGAEIGAKDDSESRRAEGEFRELLRYLENHDYFNSLWRHIEALRVQLEEALADNRSIDADRFQSLPYRESEGPGPSEPSQRPEDVPATKLGEMTIKKGSQETTRGLETGVPSPAAASRRAEDAPTRLWDEETLLARTSIDATRRLGTPEPDPSAASRGLEAAQIGKLGEKTIKEKSIEVTRRLVSTVPGAKRLVEAFDYDLGPFLLFIHFILCCLHRRDHIVLDPQKDDDEAARFLDASRARIFCESRRSSPKADGPAAYAQKRLREIMRLIEDFSPIHSLKLSESEAADLPDFDTRSETTIRDLHLELHKEFSELVQKIDTLRQDTEPDPGNWQGLRELLERFPKGSPARLVDVRAQLKEWQAHASPVLERTKPEIKG